MSQVMLENSILPRASYILSWDTLYDQSQTGLSLQVSNSTYSILWFLTCHINGEVAI